MLHSSSPKAILQENLKGLILLDDLKTQYSDRYSDKSASQIPLYRVKSPSSIIYRCPIALQFPDRAVEFAHKIVERFVEKFGDRHRFSVEIVRSPWIDFRLGDRALADWLQELLRKPLSLPQKNTPSQIDLCQYVHARCLSLLYSAARDQLITLYPLQKCLNWQWQEPQSIPWLESSQLRLQHPTESALIAELVDIGDRTIGKKAENWHKLALQLGDRFLACDRACRIWGQPVELARARLALVAVVQRVLHWILQEKLRVIPWLEC